MQAGTGWTMKTRVSLQMKKFTTLSLGPRMPKLTAKEQKMQVVCNMDAARSCAATETPKHTLEIILANALHLQPQKTVSHSQGIPPLLALSYKIPTDTCLASDVAVCTVTPKLHPMRICEAASSSRSQSMFSLFTPTQPRSARLRRK